MSAAFLLSVAVAGPARAGHIELGSDLTSGEVSLSDKGEEGTHLQLSPPQLAMMQHWLKKHRSGWSGEITPSTVEPTELHFHLAHQGGGVTLLVVLIRASGGHYLRVTGPDQWAYRSFGGLFKSWAATRALSDQELAQLQRIAAST